MSAAAVERAFQDEWAGVLATLARRLGDLELAEDATQDAFAAAAEHWPRDGVPDNPGAWLTVTAWRRALNRLRHEKLLAERTEALRVLAGRTHSAEELAVETEAPVADDRLRLVFTCCHPALALEARVALTLRCVGGLTTAEIARAFLVPEATMAQRLVRAKRKIRQAGIPYEVPEREDLPARLGGVLAVVYLVFNEGYASSGEDRLLRTELCAEAVRLGRLLHRLLPEDAETAGLFALMLLHDARSAGRVDADGRPVPLAEQDRGRWRSAEIAEGLAVLDRAIAIGRPGPYQLQAAVAALHARAPTVEATDWAQIAALYRELGRLAPSPVVEVNRAVAVGLADGPLAGLAVLEPLLAGGLLGDYAPLHAAHADLLERAGRSDAAAEAWARAAASTTIPAHRAELERRARGGHAR